MTRTIAIEQHRDRRLKASGAKIRLAGQWLEQHGFRPGSRVEILPAPGGALILRPVASGLPATPTLDRITL